MKAYVINHDQLKQYAAIAIAAILLSFFLGYYIGSASYTNAESTVEQLEDSNNPAKETSTDLASNQTSSSENEKKPDLSSGKATSKKVDKKEKKVDRKKDSKEKKVASPKKQEQKKAAKAQTKKPPQKLTKKESTQKKTPKKDVAAKPAKTKASEKKQVAKSTTATEEKKNVNKEITGETAADNKPVDDKDELTSPVEEKRAYSIQAGMFASRTNAKSFIEKLAEKNFEAYVADFVSTSGAIKYNVRVGRFEERDKAREKLKEFQKSFSTPAYVVIAK